MTKPSTSRSTAEKLALFRACFSGLDHVYGTYDPATGRVRQVKRPVTDTVLLHHLQGVQPFGVYLLVGDRTGAVVADFDRDDSAPPLRFMEFAARAGIATYLERSKSKGWHAWLFSERSGVSAAKGRAVVRWILAETRSPATEIFPKQDRLVGNNTFGNFVNACLWGRLFPQGRTVFVDPADGFKPYPDQWQLLERVRRISESCLDEIIARHRLSVGDPRPRTEKRPAGNSPRATYGLAPCAQRMLAEGVVEHQRVACFRLALHLKKTGLPEELAAVCLRAWAQKNHPSNGKRIISDAEIEVQTRAAYSKDYRGCGCEEPVVQRYCSPACPLLQSNKAT